MNWYVVQSQPHQEALSETTIRRLGVETFLPRIKQRKIIRRVARNVVSPLFPGYLFVRTDLKRNFRAVKYARGVRDILSFGSIPTIVDDSIIESIKSRLKEDGIISESPAFKPGQAVRIQGGAFQGIEAVFECEMSDRQRAMVLLQVLSGQARLVVDLALVVNL